MRELVMDSRYCRLPGIRYTVCQARNAMTESYGYSRCTPDLNGDG